MVRNIFSTVNEIGQHNLAPNQVMSWCSIAKPERSRKNNLFDSKWICAAQIIRLCSCRDEHRVSLYDNRGRESVLVHFKLHPFVTKHFSQLK